MYDSPHQFLPLSPAEHWLEPLRERAAKVVDLAGELAGHAHPTARHALRELLRSMNSYYSNRIEGQSTTPANIEAALRHQYSGKPEIARLQRIAVAHIEAEREAEAQAMRDDARVAPLDAGFARLVHRALYRRLAPSDRTTEDGIVVEPGELRKGEVNVGRHLAPAAQSLPRFMEAYSRHYDRPRSHDAQLIAIACAHHRMVWMHPFADGNGRAARLQTQAAMLPVTRGLWSVNRGLARDVRGYYGHLAAADAPRQGDLDGRGNLTERGLLNWIDYFIGICEDQVGYMSDMLSLDSMRRKILAAVQVAAARHGLRTEAALPIYHLFAAGPLARGDFIRMTGLAERTGRAVLAATLKYGLAVSDTSHAPVRFAFPIAALPILLPALYGPEQ